MYNITRPNYQEARIPDINSTERQNWRHLWLRSRVTIGVNMSDTLEFFNLWGRRTSQQIWDNRDNYFTNPLPQPNPYNYIYNYMMAGTNVGSVTFDPTIMYDVAPTTAHFANYRVVAPADLSVDATQPGERASAAGSAAWPSPLPLPGRGCRGGHPQLGGCTWEARGLLFGSRPLAGSPPRLEPVHRVPYCTCRRGQPRRVEAT